MQDKLDARNVQTLTRVEELLACLHEDIGLLRSLKKEEFDVNSEPEVNGIRWHCLVCGHTWQGYTKLNPDIPVSCANCKSPYWNSVPKRGVEGLHSTKDGSPCSLCVKIIQRKISLIQQLKEFENFGNK